MLVAASKLLTFLISTIGFAHDFRLSLIKKAINMARSWNLCPWGAHGSPRWTAVTPTATRREQYSLCPNPDLRAGQLRDSHVLSRLQSCAFWIRRLPKCVHSVWICMLQSRAKNAPPIRSDHPRALRVFFFKASECFSTKAQWQISRNGERIFPSTCSDQAVAAIAFTLADSRNEASLTSRDLKPSTSLSSLELNLAMMALGPAVFGVR